MKERTQLSPELKQFIDTVIVPALLKEYLAELASEKSTCQEAEAVRESAATRTATVAEVK